MPLTRDPRARLRELSGAAFDAPVAPVLSQEELDSETRRATAAGRTSFGNNLAAGIEDIKASGYTARGLARAMVGDEAGGVGDITSAKEITDRANEFGIGVNKVEDVDSVGAAFEYAGNSLARLAPQIALGLATGGGGAIGRTMLARAGEKRARKSLERSVIEGAVNRTAARKNIDVLDVTPEMLNTAALKKGLKKADQLIDAPDYVKIGEGGAKAGILASSVVGQTALAQDVVLDGDTEDSVQQRAWKAATGALATGALDALPIMHLLGRYGLGEAATKAVSGGIVKRVAKNALAQGTEEGVMELAQSVGERVTHKWVNANIELLSPEAISDYVNSAAMGFIGGGAFGAPAGLRGAKLDSEAGKRYAAGFSKFAERLYTPFKPKPKPGTGMAESTGDPVMDEAESILDGLSAAASKAGAQLGDAFNKVKAESGKIIDSVSEATKRMLRGNAVQNSIQEVLDATPFSTPDEAAGFLDPSRVSQLVAQYPNAPRRELIARALLPDILTAGRLAADGTLTEVAKLMQGADPEGIDEVKIDSFLDALPPEKRGGALALLRNFHDVSTPDPDEDTTEALTAAPVRNDADITDADLAREEQDAMDEQAPLGETAPPGTTVSTLQNRDAPRTERSPGVAAWRKDGGKPLKTRMIPKNSFVMVDEGGQRRELTGRQLGKLLTGVSGRNTGEKLATLMGDFALEGFTPVPESLRAINIGRGWDVTEEQAKALAQGNPRVDPAKFKLRAMPAAEPASVSARKKDEGELNREFGRNENEPGIQLGEDAQAIENARRERSPLVGGAPNTDILKATGGEGRAADAGEVDVDAARSERESTDAFKNYDNLLIKHTGSTLPTEASRAVAYQHALRRKDIGPKEKAELTEAREAYGEARRSVALSALRKAAKTWQDAKAKGDATAELKALKKARSAYEATNYSLGGTDPKPETEVSKNIRAKQAVVDENTNRARAKPNMNKDGINLDLTTGSARPQVSKGKTEGPAPKPLKSAADQRAEAARRKVTAPTVTAPAARSQLVSQHDAALRKVSDATAAYARAARTSVAQVNSASEIERALGVFDALVKKLEAAGIAPSSFNTKIKTEVAAVRRAREVLKTIRQTEKIPTGMTAMEMAERITATAGVRKTGVKQNRKVAAREELSRRSSEGRQDSMLGAVSTDALVEAFGEAAREDGKTFAEVEFELAAKAFEDASNLYANEMADYANQNVGNFETQFAEVDSYEPTPAEQKAAAAQFANPDTMLKAITAARGFNGAARFILAAIKSNTVPKAKIMGALRAVSTLNAVRGIATSTESAMLLRLGNKQNTYSRAWENLKTFFVYDKPIKESLQNMLDDQPLSDWQRTLTEFYLSSPALNDVKLISFAQPAFDPSLNQIMMPESSEQMGDILAPILSAFDPFSVMLHEITHAATLYGESKNKAAAADLQKLLVHVREQATKQGVDIDAIYGALNTQEFLAEAFSNPKFKSMLTSIPALNTDTFKNAWAEFKHILARLLGMEPDTANLSALDEAMTIGLALTRSTEDAHILRSAALMRRTESKFEDLFGIVSPEAAQNSAGQEDNAFDITDDGIEPYIKGTRSRNGLSRLRNRLLNSKNTPSNRERLIAVQAKLDSLQAAIGAAARSENSRNSAKTKTAEHFTKVRDSLAGVDTLEGALKAVREFADDAQKALIDGFIASGAVRAVKFSRAKNASYAPGTSGGSHYYSHEEGRELESRVQLVFAEEADTLSMDPVYVLLHETTHAATSYAERTNPKARRELSRLLEHVRVKAARLGIDVDALYGLSETQEFLAEAFANSEFQDLLRAIDMPGGNQSVWDAFKDFVAKLVGGDRTALDAVLELGSQMAATTGAARNTALAAIGGGANVPPPPTALAVTPASGSQPTDYFELLNPDSRRYIEAMARRGDIYRQVRAALPASLWHALDSADEGPALLVNTMVALEMAGTLVKTYDTRSFTQAVQGLWEAISTILRLPTKRAYGRTVLKMLKQGVPPAAVDAPRVMLPDALYKAHTYINQKVKPTVKAFLGSLDASMRNTGVPAITQLATLLAQRTGEFRADGTPPLVARMNSERNQRLNSAFEVMVDANGKPWDDATKTRVLKELQSHAANVSPEAQQLRDFFEGMHAYLRRAGVQKDDGDLIGEIANYFPVVVDADKLRAGRVPMIALLKNFAPRIKEKQLAAIGRALRDVRKEIGAGPATPEQEATIKKLEVIAKKIELMSPDELAEREYDVALESLEQHVTETVTFTEGRSPQFRASNNRMMDYIYEQGSPSQIAEFVTYQDTDIERVVVKYVDRATRRAEFQRTGLFDTLPKLLEKAAQQGATPRQLQMARDYVDMIMGVYGNDYNPTIKKIADKFGISLPPYQKVQAIQSMLLTYQNFRLLPLALMSSLIDPLGVAVRTGGDMKTAFAGYRDAVKAINDKDGTTALARLATSMGIVERHAISEALTHMYGSIHDPTGRASRFNSFLFKYNGLAYVTRFSRLAALAAGNDFLIKHAASTSTESSKYLEELGLTASDIQAGADGYVLRNDKVSAALNRFVDESVVRPTPGARPGWHNDPNFALASQYKGYLYAFYNTVVRRAGVELGKGNATVLAPLLMYVPITILGEMLRDTFQDDGEEKEALDYAKLGVVRSGLLGPQIGAALDFKQSMGAYGSHPVLETIGGPTGQQIGDMYDTVLGQKETGKTLEEALPGSALYKKWND